MFQPTQTQMQVMVDLFIGRCSDYAVQMPTGRYRRVGAPVSGRVIEAHLQGTLTMGTYLLDEQGCCSFAVFDADQEEGLTLLAQVSQGLALQGVASYLEKSRRGGHLWVFLSGPTPAWAVRDWLLPFCPVGVEFYPKQDRTQGYGSLIRVPLGVHQLAGCRFPFVVAGSQGQLVPLATRLSETLAALVHVERVQVPEHFLTVEQSLTRPATTHTSQTIPTSTLYSTTGFRTIADWCAAQDPFALIGCYVRLDSRGMGHCPFGGHHSDGRDTHPSFQVFLPRRPGGTCWRCYTGDLSGNVFNFLQDYHGLSAADLWARLADRR